MPDLDALMARLVKILGDRPAPYEGTMRPPAPISMADVRTLLAAVAGLREALLRLQAVAEATQAVAHFDLPTESLDDDNLAVVWPTGHFKVRDWRVLRAALAALGAPDVDR